MKMLIKILIMNMIKIVCTTMNLNLDNFQIGYSISAGNVCHEEIGRFLITFGSTIGHCVKGCVARKHCVGLNYRSRSHACELFTSVDTNHLKDGPCFYVTKENIDIIQTPCQDGCAYGKVCENDKFGQGKCVIRDCVNTTVPEHGRILGNQKEVGKKVRYKCDSGYTVQDLSSPTVAECLNTGAWNFYTECLKINYTWDSWTSWSACSFSCGSGIRTRSKSCSVRIHGNGEPVCNMTDVGDEQQNCNQQSCPTPTHGDACTTSTDCIETEGVCIEGMCFCNKLYKYNSTTKNCTKVCSSMTSEFEEHSNKAIENFNIEKIIDITEEECKDMCLDNVSCLSFEVWSSHGGLKDCTLGSVTFDMIQAADAGKLNDRFGIKLYSRICN